ncbi:MAG: peptide deformylase [Bacteroidales bacterium]|nr:peptide deformylase [Bacteroidales bacterium]
MILPIVSYGQSVLRKKCEEIDQNHPNLNNLIEDMWETLYPADGSGLAAPQVGHLIKLFIVDSKEVFDRMDTEERAELFAGDEGIKETFINARIIKYSDDLWIENEGCLSIPTLSEEVERSWAIEIEYFNKDFQKQTKIYSGTTARIIQHEYDHTEGKLYIDYVNPLKKKLINSKLIKISKGEIKTKYKMK